ncbi:LysR substrate-binding domain-containing protein [Inhella proteolytica]|uniref:LysR family transcriptional regulator n=1 Tax=Inhella proteolytica TaxID=2795029 RepID=A0A931NGV5_9BURK|nr:LysR substrate-binding domain-containing protein [Inhella proteolytica]MBH9576469.1 LysR family transcriptional regulator [Inhella proteolytica]
MQNKPLDRLPPLELLAAFEAAARHLSFTKAAAERFVTQSAMSRQIRALEEDLGLPLFQRRHRALALTAEGQRLLAACTQALGGLRGAMRELRAPLQRELLSLTTTPGFAALWLIPRLTAFTRAHPGIDVRVDATLENRNLAAEGFDLAVRYARVGEAGRQLFAEAMQPICSPRLVDELGLPLREPADLARHTLLHIALDMDTAGMPAEWEAWLVAFGLSDLRPAARLSFTSYAEAVAAAVAGQGVALGRRPLVDDLLASGQLITPFAGPVASARAYQLRVDPAARARPAVRAFEQWLLQQAAPAGGGAGSKELSR